MWACKWAYFCSCLHFDNKIRYQIQMIDKICSCFAEFIDDFNSSFARRGYEPAYDFQHYEDQSTVGYTPFEYDAQEDLEIQHIQSYEKAFENFIGYRLVSQNKAAQMNISLFDQSFEYSSDNLGQLKLAVPQKGDNFKILTEKCYNVAQKLRITKGSYQILMLRQSEVKQNSRIKQEEKFKNLGLRIFRKPQGGHIIEYKLPCSYELYRKLINMTIVPQQQNKLIKEFKVVANIHQNLTLRYLCSQKIGALEPHDFTYLKLSEKSTKDPSGFWEICVSKDINKNQMKLGNSVVKTGKLFVVSYIKQTKRDESASIKVRTYVDLDIKTNFQREWQKILFQAKMFIQDMWMFINSNIGELV